MCHKERLIDVSKITVVKYLLRSPGERNCKWKGNEVGYFGLHTWVGRHKKKNEICSNCFKSGYTEWANKSHKYKRDLSDWLELCKPCHAKYDKNTWGLATKKFNLV